jgi:two-component system alkaline phosphatase synthesis response regulator PhoP
MSRPGEIIAREELLETVWGKDAGVDIRSVDTYVYRVRTKLGDQGAMMQTVRGRGYVFMKSDQYPVPANAAS